MKSKLYEYISSIDTAETHSMLEAVKAGYASIFEGKQDGEKDETGNDDNADASLDDDLPDDTESDSSSDSEKSDDKKENDTDEQSDDDLVPDENNDLGELTGNEDDSTKPGDVNTSNGPTSVDAETLKKELLDAGIVNKVQTVAKQCGKKTLKDALPLIALAVTKYMKNKQYSGLPKDAMKAIVMSIAQECKAKPQEKNGNQPAQQGQQSDNGKQGQQTAQESIDCNGQALMEGRFKNLLAAGLIAAAGAHGANNPGAYCHDSVSPDACKAGYEAGYSAIDDTKKAIGDGVDAITSVPGKISSAVKGWFSSDDDDKKAEVAKEAPAKQETPSKSNAPSKLDQLKNIGSGIWNLTKETASDAGEYVKDAAVATGRSTVNAAKTFGKTMSDEMEKETKDNHW